LLRPLDSRVRTLLTVRPLWQSVSMAKKFSPKFKAAALALLAKGVSTREAQAQLRKRFRNNVGEGTLRGWVKAAGAEDSAPPSVPLPDAPTAEPIPDVAEIDTDLDTYEHVVREIAAAKRRAKLAADDGNHTAAQRAGGDVVKYTLLKARLDKERKGSDDAVMIPRADLERAKRSMQERVAALAADLERTGGLVCNHCGREIRIALAKGDS
jgi:hypothetical protein